MDTQSVFEALTKSKPVNLSDLPEEFGVYALWDHEGQIRYIGSTPKATEGFRTRIYSKHATGSEGRSHKFTQAYCTGRMWRYCKKLDDPAAANEQHPADADAAKKLRNAFIRRYCRASYVTIPRNSLAEPYFASLTSLEYQLQAMAPLSMRAWEGIAFRPLSEPTHLVDGLLAELPHYAAGAERQNAIYKTFVSVVKA
ncbi:hypothetical protein [Parazoarcus communis]|uniref:hypothetical protein n=1 Tax=Parazoarcus communis TaxID=41977 RepID=UPI00131F0B76|nr:hypothetical protein [Parazoarcus communis]